MKRKQHYLELGEEAAENRRTEIKISSEKRGREEAVNSQIAELKVSPQIFIYVVIDYDKNFMYIQ